MKRRTCALITALTMMLAGSSGGAEEAAEAQMRAQSELRAAFEGAWRGTTKGGMRMEYMVTKVNLDDTVEGVMCFRYGNRGMRGYSLSEALFEHEDRITLVDRNRRYRYELFVTDDGKTTVLQSKVKPSKWKRTTQMRPTETTRCLDRFVYDEGTAPVIHRDESSPPVVGAWAGGWSDERGWMGVVVESIDEKGKATGRYCTRNRVPRTMTVWDFGKDAPFKAQASDDGRAVRLIVPWPKTKVRMDFAMTGEDTMELDLRNRNKRTGEEKREVAAMQRGEIEDGCLRRTTRAPAAKRRALPQR